MKKKYKTKPKENICRKLLLEDIPRNNTSEVCDNNEELWPNNVTSKKVNMVNI